METAEPSARLLNVPAVGPARYRSNLIRLAVCELRFPTLFELERDRPPIDFARTIRRDYPTYELRKDLSINPEGVAQAKAHSFRSRKGQWTVMLRPAALTLETQKYGSFKEFSDKLAAIVEAGKRVIDSNFFTRVGLRYINALPFALQTIADWVNPELVKPLADGVFGDVEEHVLHVRGATALGGYSFRHGVNNTNQRGDQEYILDFDFYAEDVDVANVMSVVEKLHEQEFAMFRWSLGAKAIDALGPSTLGKLGG